MNKGKTLTFVVVAVVAVASAFLFALTASATTKDKGSKYFSAEVAINAAATGLQPGDRYEPTWIFYPANGDYPYYLGGNAVTVGHRGYLQLPSVDIDTVTHGQYSEGIVRVVLTKEGDEYAVPSLGPDGLPLQFDVQLP